MYNPPPVFRGHYLPNPSFSQIKTNQRTPKITFTCQSLPKNNNSTITYEKYQQAPYSPRVNSTNSMILNQQNIPTQYHQGESRMVSLSNPSFRYFNVATNQLNNSIPIQKKGNNDNLLVLHSVDPRVNFKSPQQKPQQLTQLTELAQSQIDATNPAVSSNKLEQEINFLKAENSKRQKQISDIKSGNEVKNQLKQKLTSQNQIITILEEKMSELQYRYSDVEKLRRKLMVYENVISQQRKLVESIDDADQQSGHIRMRSSQQVAIREKLQKLYKGNLLLDAN